MLRPPREPNAFFPGGRDAPARTGGQRTRQEVSTAFLSGARQTQEPDFHFSCMVFRLTPSPLSRSQGPRTSKLSGLLGASSEGPVPGWTCQMEEPPAAWGTGLQKCLQTQLQLHTLKRILSQDFN